MTGEVEFNGDFKVNGEVQVNGEVEVRKVVSVSCKTEKKHGSDKSINQDLQVNGVDHCNCCTCCGEGEFKSNGLVVNGEGKKDDSDGSYVFVNSGDAVVDVCGECEGDSVKVDLVENKGAGDVVELKEPADPVVNCENGCYTVDGLVVGKEEYVVSEGEVSNGNNGDPVVEVSKVSDADDVDQEVKGEHVADEVEIETNGEIVLEREVLNKDGGSIVEVVSEGNAVTRDGNIPSENSQVGESVSNFESDKGEIEDTAPESNAVEEKKDCDVDIKEDKREIEAGNNEAAIRENGYPHNEKQVLSNAVTAEASEIEKMVESEPTMAEHPNVEEQSKEESSEAADENLESNLERGGAAEYDDSKSEASLATQSESAVHKEEDQNLKSTIVEESVDSELCITDNKNNNEVIENEDSKLGVAVKETAVSEPCAMDNENDNGVVENGNGELGVDVAVKESAESKPCVSDSKSDNGVVRNENNKLGGDVAVKESAESEPCVLDNKNDNGVVKNENNELGADVAIKENGESETSFTEDLSLVRENPSTELTQFSSNGPTEGLASHSGPEVGKPCEVTLDCPSSNEKKDGLPSQPSFDTVCEIKAVTESIGTSQIPDVQVSCHGAGDSVDGGKGAAENGKHRPIEKINSSSWADACSSDDENAEPATEMVRISGDKKQKLVASPYVAAEPASTEEVRVSTNKIRLSSSAIDMRSVTEICFGSLSPEEIFSTPSEDNGVGSGSPEAVRNFAGSQPLSVDMPHTNEELQMKVQDVPICDNDEGQVADQVVASRDKRDEQAIDRGSDKRPIDQEAKVADEAPNDKRPCNETVSAAVPNIEASEGKNASSGTEKKRLFNFVVRFPRQDDGNLKEQINHAQSVVAQKTEIRDAIRTEIRDQRAAYKEAADNLEAARSEERAAWDLFKEKRIEMESLQLVINKAKDLVSIDDIREKINYLNRIIQIGGISLKEEKQILNEIKPLEKRLREHRVSTVSMKDEPQQDVDQKEQNEERMKCLRKEIESLKEKALKAKAAVAATKQKHSDENEKLRQLQARFKDADEVRQNSYTRLQNLRSQLNEKNKYFWKYKNEVQESNELASKGDLQRLSQLCLERVEDFMKSWNENDQFREEYIKANARNTLRRLRTSDGRSLGPDEEPPVLPVSVNEKGAKEIAVPAPPSQDRDIEAMAVEAVPPADKLPAKPKEQKKKSAETKNPAKSIPQVEVTVSGRDEIDEVVEEEPKRSKEEEELIRKEEQLRKEEEEARLREERRMEEKIKAKEAFERKKRNAEKAQARAALRAQKEAEQKEKEKEKKAKKKEKKKLSGASLTDANKEGESAPPVEAPAENPVELETKEVPLKNSKKPKRPSHFVKVTKVKSIPPPLRNRGKRKMQPWMWVLFIVVLFLGLFALGNGWFLF